MTDADKLKDYEETKRLLESHGWLTLVFSVKECVDRLIEQSQRRPGDWNVRAY